MKKLFINSSDEKDFNILGQLTHLLIIGGFFDFKVNKSKLEFTTKEAEQLKIQIVDYLINIEYYDYYITIE